MKLSDDRILGRAEDIPELNSQRMTELAQTLFEGRSGMGYSEYLHKLELAYTGWPADFETICQSINFAESATLALTFLKIRERLNSVMGRERFEDGRLLEVGCGEGRLSNVLMLLGERVGIHEMTLNDISQRHIEATQKNVFHKEKFIKEQISINFKQGDFSQLPIGNTFSIIVAFRSSTSEIFNPSTPKDFSESRMKLYAKISTLLDDDGIFIEDVPDPDVPGFYKLQALKTKIILSRLGILNPIEDKFLITHYGEYPTIPIAGQIRTINNISSDLEEKRLANLYPFFCISQPAPEKAIATLQDALEIISSSPELSEAYTKLQRRIQDGDVKYPIGTLDKVKHRRTTCYQKIPSFS